MDLSTNDEPLLDKKTTSTTEWCIRWHEAEGSIEPGLLSTQAFTGAGRRGEN